MVTISVKNLGPLAEGEVELRPLTLFVGPSNTGKSYMATAIWAVTQAFQEVAPPGLPAWAFLDGFRWPSYGRKETPPPSHSEASKLLQEWVDGLSDDPYDESFSFAVNSLPAATQRETEKFTHPLLHEIGAAIVSQFVQAYGPDAAFARNDRSEDFSLLVRRVEPLLNMEVRLKALSVMAPACDVSQAEIQARDYQRWMFLRRQRDNRIELLRDAIFAAAVASAQATVSTGFPANTYYLPSSRSGIVQGRKVLAAALVRQSRRVGIQPIGIPTLPGMTTEFLSQMLALDKDGAKRRPPASELRQAIAFIESEVVGGQIDFDESDGLPLAEIVYLPGPVNAPTGKYTLDQVSSMVSELAPVVLFLKYLVRPGDLLILEEPESHLHPASQRQMACAVVRLVNAGVRVLITTHSDMFVSQINNLLRLSYASRRWRREHNFQPEDSLRHDQIAAYLFNQAKDQDGMAITRLEIDPDVGVDEDEFGKVINAIYEETLLVERIRVK